MAARAALLALLLGPAVARGASAEPPPAPEVLLERILSEPDASYEGRVLVTQWYGGRARSEEMIVRHRAPGLLRREHLAPDGSVAKVSISDGDVERILEPSSGRSVSGDAVGAYEKSLPPAREREILLSNYELTSGTGEPVAARPVWTLAFLPREAGKPLQTFSLDRETGVVLAVRRHVPGRRRLAASARFLRFDPKKTPDAALFDAPSASGAVSAPGLSPDFMSREQLNAAPGGGRFPDALPGGFVFESGDSFAVKGHAVRHARYTDGFTTVSLFHADRRFGAPRGGPEDAAGLAGAVSVTSAGRVLQWKAPSGHYMLMADLSRPFLERLAASLGAPALKR